MENSTLTGHPEVKTSEGKPINLLDDKELQNQRWIVKDEQLLRAKIGKRGELLSRKSYKEHGTPG